MHEIMDQQQAGFQRPPSIKQELVDLRKLKKPSQFNQSAIDQMHHVVQRGNKELSFNPSPYESNFASTTNRRFDGRVDSLNDQFLYQQPQAEVAGESQQSGSAQEGSV